MLRYLWRYYLRLRRRKAMGFASANPIEWPDILAFTALNRIELSPFELQLIEAIDDLYRSPETKTPAPTAGKGKGVMGLASARDPANVKSLLRSFTGDRGRGGGRIGRRKGG